MPGRCNSIRIRHYVWASYSVMKPSKLTQVHTAREGQKLNPNSDISDFRADILSLT